MTAQELKDWRYTHKLSQGALAARLAVHEITVSRWERGSSPIPPFLRLALWAIDHDAYPGYNKKPRHRLKRLGA